MKRWVKKSCLRKRRYADQESALDGAVYRTLKGAPRLRAYACKVCSGWHLSKSFREEQK